MPVLRAPTVDVRDSYLRGESELAVDEGRSTSWLAVAAADFAGFVRRRSTVRRLWDVPATELWFVEGSEYLGTVMIRHRLTPALAESGGHVGYHVVPVHRRRGHATAMLREALAVCRGLGLTAVLVTCAPDNVGSRKVIEANGGVAERYGGQQRHFRFRLDPRPASSGGPDVGSGATVAG